MTLSTASCEHGKAVNTLQEAEDRLWREPSCPNALRRVEFWTKEVEELAAMPSETIIPLH